MDMRYMRGMDGRRLPPRNARGEFRRRRRGDRGMPMHEDMRRDMNYTGGRVGYPMRGGDYAQNEMANMDMRGDYRGNDMGDMARRNDYGYDGHYGMHGGRQGGYEPVEFMGYCSGYYGSPEQDYARGGRRDYGYDMRYGRDYGYPMYEHDYGYGEDYGEKLSDKELEDWCHKLKSQLTEQEKQMFSKENIMQRAKAMGKPMEGFGEKELEVATLMVFTDYKQTIGNNIDLAIKLAYDWLSDKDVKVKGAEKLAVYYDEIVMGGEDD
jgi:hypothetical protein